MLVTFAASCGGRVTPEPGAGGGPSDGDGQVAPLRCAQLDADPPISYVHEPEISAGEDFSELIPLDDERVALVIGRDQAPVGQRALVAVFSPWGDWPTSAGEARSIPVNQRFLVAANEDGTLALVSTLPQTEASMAVATRVDPVAPPAELAFHELPELGLVNSPTLLIATSGGLHAGFHRAVGSWEHQILTPDGAPSSAPLPRLGCGPLPVGMRHGADAMVVTGRDRCTHEDNLVGEERVLEAIVVRTTGSIERGDEVRLPRAVRWMALVPRPGGAWLLYLLESETQPSDASDWIHAVPLDAAGRRAGPDRAIFDTESTSPTVSASPLGEGFAITSTTALNNQGFSTVFDGAAEELTRFPHAWVDGVHRMIGSPDGRSLLLLVRGHPGATVTRLRCMNE